MIIANLEDAMSSPFWQQLAKCAAKGGSDEAELKRKIADGHAVVWQVEGGAFALVRTAADVCVAWLGVGNLRALVSQEAGIENFARDNGCRALRIEGRPGWARIFRNWKNTGSKDGVIVLEREL